MRVIARADRRSVKLIQAFFTKLLFDASTIHQLGPGIDEEIDGEVALTWGVLPIAWLLFVCYRSPGFATSFGFCRLAYRGLCVCLLPFFGPLPALPAR